MTVFFLLDQRWRPILWSFVLDKPFNKPLDKNKMIVKALTVRLVLRADVQGGQKKKKLHPTLAAILTYFLKNSIIYF